MKIVLCIFLLFITAVSVFSQSVELNGIVGKRIEFPAAVETSGNLMYGSKVIGYVSSGALIPLTTPEYQGRVQWDSSTGLFSLSELRLKDSGVYEVNNTNGKTSVSFHLTVWKDNVPVSKPHVSTTHDEYPCTLLCSVEKGTEVTLSWYREGQKKPYVTSPVQSAPGLHLPQAVERSGTYTCEAKNSVSNEKASITVGADCTAGPSTGTIVGIIFAVVAIFIAGVFAVLYWRIRKEQADEEALILDAFRRVIRDEANQGLIKDVIRSKLEDKCNRGLLLVDEANQGLIKDDEANQGLIKDDKCNRGLLLVVFGKVIQDEAYQVLIKDAVRRLILVKDILNNVDPRALHEANQGLIKDVKDILDKVDPRALRSVMSDRSDELEDETPQTGSYIITSQP